MLKWLSSKFAAARAPAAELRDSGPVADFALPWRDGTSHPIPDWDAYALHQPGDAALRDDWWTAAAVAWLRALGESLGAEFELSASPRFLLLSSLPQRRREVVLGYCERTRSRILREMEGIAAAAGHGKHVLVVVDDAEQYYDYVGNYYPESGEFATSSGMFIHGGYGHFVLVASEIDAMEPIVAHELTHALLSHLAIPAWLNEGLAVNMERRLVPSQADPANQLYWPREMAEKHAAFWNTATIQEFWSGKSFLRVDDGNRLSYDLAQKMVAIAGRDYARLREFCNGASRDDGGDGASRAAYGFPIHELAESVIGAGPWQVRPASWRGQVESGAFD